MLRFASNRIETMLLFVVRDGLALGWKGRGPGIAATHADKLLLPSNVPSMFHEAVEHRKSVGGPVGPVELHKHFYRTLQKKPPPSAIVVPVVVKNKTVNLIMPTATDHRAVVADGFVE